jgi:cytochrome c-type biogenesis protein CcmH/NrfF
MRTDSFSEEALRSAYQQAAEKNSADFQQFAEQSKMFDFAVTALGAGLSMNVECDTGLPVSTPAEKREKLFQNKLKQSQTKANKIADRQRKIAETLAKKVTRKMQKELRAKK